jgi:hypothetical protein
MVGVRYESPLAGFQVSTGLPTDSEQPLWGAMSGWGRVSVLERRGLFAGVDLGGSGFVIRDGRAGPGGIAPGPLSSGTGYGVSGQALPVFGYQGDRVGAEARTGVFHFRSRLGDGERDHTVWLTEGQGLVSPVHWIAAGPVVRHYRSEGGAGDTYVGGSLILSYLGVGAWASAGEWIDRVEPGLPWGAGLSVRVHPRLRVSAGYREEGFNPLYLREAQSLWSFGVSLQIGGPVPPRRSEYESGLVDPDGEVTIRLADVETNSAPRVAGDFNGWLPAAMVLEGEVWHYALSLPSGVYHYAFVDADGRWFVPESAPGRRPDGFGGYVAIVVVP